MKLWKWTNARRARWMAIVLASLWTFGCEGGDGAWSVAPGVVHTDQRVGIGTDAPQVDLAVKGTIVAQEVKVTVDDWPDYVFDEDYALIPLAELGARVRTEGHLPGIPNADAIARDGLELGAAHRQLLKQVEELTLYVLDLERANASLSARVAALERRGER